MELVRVYMDKRMKQKRELLFWVAGQLGLTSLMVGEEFNSGFASYESLN